MHTLRNVSRNHNQLAGTEYIKGPSPVHSHMILSQMGVWKSSLLWEHLWLFATLGNCHLLAIGGQLENPHFYEHFCHLAAVHNCHCTFPTSWKAWYTYYYSVYAFSVSRLLASLASIRFHIPPVVLVLWQMKAEKANDPYTESSIEQNSRAMVEYDYPKRLLKDSVVPYTCYMYYTVMVFTCCWCQYFLCCRKHGHWSSHIQLRKLDRCSVYISFFNKFMREKPPGIQIKIKWNQRRE